MKNPKRQKLLLVAGTIVLLVGILWFVMVPKDPLDLSKDEEPFPSIIMPPQAVYGGEYMDGGSIGVLIVDHSGAKHELSFPIEYDGIKNAHPTAYFGNINDPKMTPLKNPDRAKEITIRLLTEFGKEMENSESNHTASARRSLSSPPQIVAVRAFAKARRFLSPND